jgi:putative sterol carrier protein
MVEVKTPREFFEKILPSRFNREKAKGVDAIVNISILGDNGGEWSVTIKNQTLKVENRSDKTPTLSLRISESDYLDVINGKLSGERAFFTGKLKLEGNITQALKLKDAGLF